MSAEANWPVFAVPGIFLPLQQTIDAHRKAVAEAKENAAVLASCYQELKAMGPGARVDAGMDEGQDCPRSIVYEPANVVSRSGGAWNPDRFVIRSFDGPRVNTDLGNRLFVALNVDVFAPVRLRATRNAAVAALDYILNQETP